MRMVLKLSMMVLSGIPKSSVDINMNIVMKMRCSGGLGKQRIQNFGEEQVSKESTLIVVRELP
jgi:hypothetical protein